METGTGVGGGVVAAAQCGEECGGGGPTYGVEVGNPAGVTRPANSGPYTAYFSVYNSGSTSNTYSLLCSTLGGVTCVSVFPTSITLQSLDDNVGAVTYNVGSTSGTLRLKALGFQASDIGSMSVTAVAEGPPIVAIANRNDDNWDRSMCLVAGAGPGASVCGDLLVSHAMPGFQTLGRERALTLVYSSHQAAPEPLVAATVSTPAGTATPSSVHAQLWLNLNGPLIFVRSADFTAWSGGPRQLALSFDASGYATGAYQYVLIVDYIYAGGSYSTTETGMLAIVNRSQSALGRGWSVAGVEELYFNQPEPSGSGILWVGGDGSAKLYTQVSGTTDRWVAPLGAYRDTIVDTGSGYTRYLRHGVQVTYDGTGKHQKTINRVGQETVFAWSSGRLDSITVPPAGVTGQTYTLSYVSNMLDKITDPGGRILNATVTAGELVALTDPDNLSVAFGYDAAGRMDSRTNRRNYTTTFAYSTGLRLTSVSVPDGPTGATLATTTFEPWDHEGFASSGPGPFIAQDTSLVYTKILGPRPGVNDDATFRVDRWGAPVSITDPLGYVTTVVRGDAANPTRVTAVTYPNSRVVQMQWNARGNLTQVTDDPLDLAPAVTTYTYDTGAGVANFDGPITVTDPDGVTTQYQYQGSGGLLPGVLDKVTAPNGHDTEFVYETTGPAKGLIKEVKERNVEVWDTLTYAFGVQSFLTTKLFYNGHGNLDSTETPFARRTRFDRDSLQRVTHSYDPAGHHTEVVYDPMNRVKQQIEHILESGGPFTTTTSYTNGLLTLITDPRQVTRGYDHDARGRVIYETDEQGVAETTFYDRAGLVDSVRTRRGHTVRYKYDDAGQLKEKAWPTVDFVPADSVTYTYDNMGNMETATTHDTSSETGGSDHNTVVRTYYGNGLLKSEDQGNGFLVNTYGYTAAGRRATHVIGDFGVTATSDDVSYSYVDGALETVNVRWRGNASITDSVSFDWDALGRRKRLTYANGAFIAFAYDADGRKRVMCGRHSGSSGNPHAFRFDHVNKTLDLDGLVTEVTPTSTQAASVCDGTQSGAPVYSIPPRFNNFNSRHQLTDQTGVAYTYDSSGNMITKTKSVFSYTYTMPVGSNRLATWAEVGWSTHPIVYNPDGSRASESACTPNRLTDRSYSYDALGRTERIVTGPTNNDCAYEPLGRLVRPCEVIPGTAKLGYDGDNVVRTEKSSVLEAWTFIHGPGLDDPIMGRSAKTNFVVYFMTDGTGGFISVGRTYGADASSDSRYVNWGGKYHGATGEPTTYDADRASGDLADLGFFRNRFYDQRTGRWTQEDPIGVAGGLNLYAFNGNNPVAFSDPFGLCPKDAGGDGKTEGFDDCPEGSSGYYAHRAANGDGGLLNDLQGAYASCKESAGCTAVGVVGAVVTGGILIRGAIAAIAGGTTTAGTGGVLTSVEVTFGHGARHLVGKGLSAAQVEGVIAAEITRQVVGRATLTGGFWGRVVVGGQNILYQAYTLRRGLINVGTYRPVP